MKKSSSSPSLSTLSGNTGMKRVAVSCNALPAMAMETSLVYLAKVPFTQVYSCYHANSPDLKDPEHAASFATCMATPPDPVDEETNSKIMRYVNPGTPPSLERYQLWYDRIKSRRKSTMSSSNNNVDSK